MKTFFAIIMVLCSMILMQIHSIEYWTQKAGSTGWAWSIGLEIAMLWFWYENKPFLKLFKYLSAFLLIVGPWYQITESTFENLNNASFIQAEISAAQNTIDQLSISLSNYEERSGIRSGWSGRIDKTQIRLDKVRMQLSILRAKEVKGSKPWRERTIAGMQLAALFIILTAQLAAVTSLRSRNNSSITKNITKNHNRKHNRKNNIVTEQGQESHDLIIKAAAERINALVQDYGSQARLCKDLNLRPADISNILNHKEKKEAGAATISQKALQKITDILTGNNK